MLPSLRNLTLRHDIAKTILLPSPLTCRSRSTLRMRSPPNECWWYSNSKEHGKHRGECLAHKDGMRWTEGP